MKITLEPIKEITVNCVYEITFDEYLEAYVTPDSYQHLWANGLLLSVNGLDESAYTQRLLREKQTRHFERIVFVRLPKRPKIIKNQDQGITNIVLDVSKDPIISQIARWVLNQ
jgi:hypothetical protein